ncbi:MAG TPA: GIY-YIG nuclease family protein [Candidatus Uhrbacteria bacterium]|nr:GIY-YIG nuclease family protein [Candidatus Uhrbacteria bacterium]
MKIVYLIQSQKDASIYVGVTSDLEDRLKRHNKGEVQTTKMRAPWKLICYFSFETNQTAYDFERYLKTGSGCVFLKKHFLK